MKKLRFLILQLSIQKAYKKRRNGKYHILNEILYNWYGKCTSSNIYPGRALLQKESMGIFKKYWVKKS